MTFSTRLGYSMLKEAELLLLHITVSPAPTIQRRTNYKFLTFLETLGELRSQSNEVASNLKRGRTSHVAEVARHWLKEYS